MNQEPLDDLEAELLRLRPVAPSPDAQRRVTERLCAPHWTPRRWVLTLAAAAAAGVLVLAFWPREQPGEVLLPGTSAAQRDAPPHPRAGTLAEYRRVIDKSSAALEELLNHAEAVTRNEPRIEVRAGFRFNERYLDTLGVP
jgi:hypothetical protein